MNSRKKKKLYKRYIKKKRSRFFKITILSILITLGTIYGISLHFYPKATNQLLTTAASFGKNIVARSTELFESKKESFESLAEASHNTQNPSAPNSDSNESSDTTVSSPASSSNSFSTSSSENAEEGTSSQEQEPDMYTENVYLSMLDTCCGSMLYYHQGDSRWGDFLFGGKDPMKQYGCGPTAMAMLINSFSDTPTTPSTMAQWAAENGYYASGSGSYHSFIPDSLTAFGLSVESVTDRSVKNVENLLSSGHLLVALMGPGSLTNNGHFVIFTRLLENGNISIADPNSFENSTKEWNLSQLLSELSTKAGSGGPLWAVKP